MNEQPTEAGTVAEIGQGQGQDAALMQTAWQTLRGEQNLAIGLIAGLIAALAGAAVWAALTAVTEYQIGWMAVGVGFLVGYAVRFAGKGLDKIFGVAGALLALVGCLLGNLFTVCYFVGVNQEMSFFEVLSRLTPSIVVDLLAVTFSPMDLLFYGIAVYEGYRFSFRQVTEAELTQALKGPGASLPA